MATIAQFSKNMFRRGRALENSSSEVVRSAARRALRSLVQNTPADTGKARSNWKVGIGSQSRHVIQPYVPYKKGSKAGGLGISETANANAAIAAGIARINSVRGKAGVGLTTAIFISNNLKYIEKLNNGSSTQVGAGFVERALLEARLTIKGFRSYLGGF